MRVHISLPVKDLEKSRDFYSSLFGAPASKVKSDYLNFRLDKPSIHLALVQSDLASPSPAQHYGIELPDAGTYAVWEDRANRVEEAAAVEPEPDAKCCYARAEKVWLTDPDGPDAGERGRPGNWVRWPARRDADSRSTRPRLRIRAARGSLPACYSADRSRRIRMFVRAD